MTGIEVTALAFGTVGGSAGALICWAGMTRPFYEEGLGLFLITIGTLLFVAGFATVGMAATGGI